ncbi:MAG: phage tail tape measure protein [Lachnospiraceae bacterium]|nr:phage tail tape measure protein [Lachnospiraceae bacterium]
MAVNTIGSKIVLEGEKEYREALKNINTEQKELRSEMRLATSEFDGQQNSLDALTKKHEILTKQIEAQSSKVELYTKRLEDSEKAQQLAGEKVETLSEKLKDANKEMEDMADSSDASEEALDDQRKKIDELSKQLAESNKEYEKAGNATTNWKTQINNAQSDLNTMNADLKNMDQYMEEAQQSTNGCASSIDVYGKSVKDAGEKSEQFGKSGVAAIGALADTMAAQYIKESVQEITEALEECTEKAKEYETAVAKLSTIADESQASTQSLSTEILKLSIDTGAAAGGLADVAYNAISAGVQTKDSVDMARTATELATAGFTDSASALSVLTTTLNAYGDEAGTAAEISDSLIMVQNLGVTTVGQLAASMGKAIATGSAYNVNLGNIESAYVSMTKGGINTAESTTYLAGMLKELGDSGSDVSKVIEEYTGKSFARLMKEGKTLSDVLQILYSSVGNDSTALMNLWSSAEAGKASNAILNQGFEQFNKNLITITGSAGATAGAYEKMADTTEMADNKMTSAMDALAITIGDELNPSLNDLKETGADAFVWASDFLEDNPEIVDGIAALTVGMETLAVGIVVAKVATLDWTAVLNLNPVVAMTGAVVALISAIATYSATADNGTIAMKLHADELQRSIDKTNENIQAIDEAAQKGDAEIGVLNGLKNTVTQLNAKESLSTEEKKKMAAAVQTLNEKFPDLSMAIDETTGKVLGNTDALNDNIDAMIKSAEIAALQEHLTDVTNEYIDAQEQLAQAQTEVEAAEKNLTDAQNAYNEALENGTITGYEEYQSDVSIALDNARIAQEKSNEALQTADYNVSTIEENMGNYATRIQEVNDALMEENAAMADCAETQVVIGDKTYELNDATEQQKEQIGELSQAYYEAKDAATDSINSQVGLFEELSVKSEMSTSQMSENLKSQTDAFTQYKDDILACSQLVEQGILDEGLLGSIQELGMDGAGYMHELATASADDIGKVVESFQQMEDAKDNLAGVIADVQTGYSEQMEELLGIQIEKQDEYKTNVQECNDAVGESMTETGEQIVTSASDTMTSMNEEITTGTVTVTKSMSDLCTSMIETTNTSFNIVEGKSLVFRDIGKMIPDSMAEGIQLGTSSLIKAIQKMIDDMTDAAVAKVKSAASKIDKALGDALS